MASSLIRLIHATNVSVCPAWNNHQLRPVRGRHKPLTNHRVPSHSYPIGIVSFSLRKNLLRREVINKASPSLEFRLGIQHHSRDKNRSQAGIVLPPPKSVGRSSVRSSPLS